MTEPYQRPAPRCPECGGPPDTGAGHDCEPRPEPRAYNIVRFYQSAGIRRRIIRRRVTLTVAQLHCTNPETSSRTATGAVARARTRRVGAWFDGYEER